MTGPFLSSRRARMLIRRYAAGGITARHFRTSGHEGPFVPFMSENGECATGVRAIVGG